jgi:2-polyprenyl-6-hydroxyphenyl methylase/3-demethylubiquinone-9 3-methyltransferase
LFGPYEYRISDAYRSIFVDIDAFVELTCEWKPHAEKILEVGCGEGAVTQRLRSAYPGAEITAIDITPRVGRLYKGPRDNLRFICCAVQEIAANESGKYDLVMLSDVMHHVPTKLRQDLLDASRAAMAPQGTFVFKDWQRSFTPIHWLVYFLDRWLTGDRVSYMSREEMRERLAITFGESAIIGEARVAPWSNNLATLVRP